MNKNEIILSTFVIKVVQTFCGFIHALPSSHSLYCVWAMLNHLSWQVWWLHYPGLWRADAGHPLLWLVICIFIATVTSSVNTPLTSWATSGADGLTLLSHLKWERLLNSGSASAEAQVPVDLAFLNGNGVSSHVNVDFPLGKDDWFVLYCFCE